MLLPAEPSAVLRRCREAFPEPAQPARVQAQAPIAMPAMERMNRHRQIVGEAMLSEMMIDKNIEPDGTMHGSPAWKQAKRIQAQRLGRFAPPNVERRDDGISYSP